MAEQIGARADSAGRRAFEIASVIFFHGVAKQLAKGNPCGVLKLPAILGKKRPIRATVSINEDQLRAVLAGIPLIGRKDALAVKILLGTCVRKVELRLARRKLT